MCDDRKFQAMNNVCQSMRLYGFPSIFAIGFLVALGIIGCGETKYPVKRYPTIAEQDEITGAFMIGNLWERLEKADVSGESSFEQRSLGITKLLNSEPTIVDYLMKEHQTVVILSDPLPDVLCAVIYAEDRRCIRGYQVNRNSETKEMRVKPMAVPSNLDQIPNDKIYYLLTRYCSVAPTANDVQN